MSKIDHKLEHFANDIMVDVSEERRQIIEEIDHKLTGLYDKKEIAYLEKAYDLIQEALIKIDQEKNEILSRTAMDNRMQLLQKRNETIALMYSEATEKLRAYTKTEGYVTHILDLIESAKALLGEGELTVCLSASDENIIKEISEKSGLVVTLESKRIDFIGGCKVYNRTNNMVVDDTFLRKLEDQHEDFITKCQLNIE